MYSTSRSLYVLAFTVKSITARTNEESTFVPNPPSDLEELWQPKVPYRLVSVDSALAKICPSVRAHVFVQTPAVPYPPTTQLFHVFLYGPHLDSSFDLDRYALLLRSQLKTTPGKQTITRRSPLSS